MRTYNYFIINPGLTICFVTGSTTNISRFQAIGTYTFPITLSGITSGTWSINKSSSGIVALTDYLKIYGSTARPLNVWYAGVNSVDGGSNSGWIFSLAPKLIPVQTNNKIMIRSTENGKILFQW